MKKKYKKGLTLIELLVVVAIITILAAILLPYVANRAEDARISRVEQEISVIKNAVTLLFNDTSKLPNDWYSFVTPAFSNWKGPYINKSPSTDPADNKTWLNASPWKTTYRLHVITNTPNSYFARADQLYPFANGVALEIEEGITNTDAISANSLQKIDQELDNDNAAWGFIVEADTNTSPFVQAATMPGLATTSTYSGTVGKSMYILLFTY